MCLIYGWEEEEKKETEKDKKGVTIEHGPVISFNLLNDDGVSFVGYSTVETLATLSLIHLRTGCFCNPGACQRYLKLTPETVRAHIKAGHVCWDANDVIDGMPTGAVRVSISPFNTYKDIDRYKYSSFFFLSRFLVPYWDGKIKLFQRMNHFVFVNLLIFSFLFFLRSNFLVQSIPSDVSSPQVLRQRRRRFPLTAVYFYPIKSCAPVPIQSTWPLSSTGLLFDRQWTLIDAEGEYLSQKRFPRMSLIQPHIDRIVRSQ